MEPINVTMKYVYHYDIDTTDREKDDIWKMLCNTNLEFVPPLSSRNSTAHQNFADKSNEDTPMQYYLALQNQEWLLVLEGSQVIGFMSFYRTGGNTIYISTVIVDPWHRNKGACLKLYKAIQEFDWWERIRTRTWSTNIAHINLLKKIGFHSTRIIQDHRGPGISTVYFEKIRELK